MIGIEDCAAALLRCCGAALLRCCGAPWLRGSVAPAGDWKQTQIQSYAVWPPAPVVSSFFLMKQLTSF